MSAFSSLMGSSSSLPNATGSGNMFGSGSSLMSEALNRLNPDKQSSMKSLMETLSSGGSPFNTSTIDFANKLSDLRQVG
jgi:hypothetical protein